MVDRPYTEPLAASSALQQGQNASMAPSSLSRNAYWKGLNIMCRGSLLRSRPPWSRLTKLGSGHFRGLFTYSRITKDSLILGQGGEVNILPLEDALNLGTLGAMADDVTPFWFCKANKYLVVQNGADWPLIFDGNTPVPQNAVADHQRLPKGKAMCYVQGRLCVVVDEVYDQATYALIPNLGYVQIRVSPVFLSSTPSSFLTFSEDTYFAGGGALGMPVESGEIKALIGMRNVQTGTGYGQLYALAQQGISAFNLLIPREQWGDQQIGQGIFFDSGTEAPFSPIAVNDDILYRSIDGQRSLRYTATDVASGSGLFSNPTISTEIDYLLAKDPLNLHERVTMAKVDNRIFVTTGAFEEEGATYFKGMAAYDAAVLTQTGQKPASAWDGFWSGPKLMAITKAKWKGRERLFAVAKENADNVLWMLDDRREQIYDKTSTKRLCRAMYRSEDFGSSNVIKTFNFATAFISKLRGQATLCLYWRPDGYPLWIKSQTAIFQGPDDGSFEQDRPFIRLAPQEQLLNDPVTGRKLDSGATFQFCVEWTGDLQVDRIIYDVTTSDTFTKLRKETDKVSIVAPTHGYNLDDFDYSIPV